MKQVVLYGFKEEKFKRYPTIKRVLLSVTFPIKANLVKNNLTHIECPEELSEFIWGSFSLDYFYYCGSELAIKYII